MIEIVDLVGEPVKPGSLVAFSKNGVADLQVGIVIEIFSERLTYFIKSRRKKYKYDPSYKASSYPRNLRGRGPPRKGRTFIGYGDWKVRKGWIALTPKAHTQNRLVVITNPLFLLDNENIANQLEIVDMAKDAGLLPQDYIFGQPTEINTVDLEEESNDDET